MLDQRLPMTLAGPNIDLNSELEHPKTLLFLEDGLDENKTHSVTLMNSVSNPNRPLYFDYAIVRGSQKFVFLLIFIPTFGPRVIIAFSFSGATPSSNASFTIPVTSSPSTSKSKTGAIVGGVIGGIAGLATMSFIGFILLRHWKSSRSTHATRIDLFNPVISEIGPIELTPFVVPDNTGLFSTKKSSSLPVSAPRAALSSDSPQEGTVQVEGQQVSEESPNQPHANMNMQEEDAGPFEHSTLPPRYNDDWQGAIAR